MGIEAPAASQPTIIKRKKVYKADGHHGGAWKVAYADFVTAMMAFFLLMWLLNATTEEQRKGISDYFSPSIPVSRISGGGTDGLNGDSVFTEDTLSRSGTGGARPENEPFPTNRESTSETASTQAVADNLANLKESLGEESQQVSDHLLVKMSPEGIVLEVTDSEQAPLFQVGSSRASDLMRELLLAVSGSFDAFGNDLKIVGHTDSLRYRDSASYDNWNLSADRANAARRLLVEAGLDPARIREVSGKADTEPLDADNPLAAQNRRISITILTK
ncbi:MAG: OmpA family protein [Hyphomonadaceae bacterium]|nr:OmpA family protein [Hyphomonadaceae bacterium]